MHSESSHRSIAASLLALLLTVGQGCARDEATLDADLARELYALSRIPPEIDVARSFLDAQIATYRTTWSPEQFDAAVRVTEAGLAGEPLSRKILERLEAQPAPEFTDTVLEWLRTPEARQIHAAAAATSDAEAIAEFKDFMAAENQQPLSEERQALIERYDEAARCSNDSVASLRLAIYAAASIADALDAKESGGGADASWQFAEERSKLLAPLFEEVSVLTLRFAFRGMSDADVAAFVERSESEAMQWYYQTLSNAFLDTFEEISKGLGAAVVTSLESQPDA